MREQLSRANQLPIVSFTLPIDSKDGIVSKLQRRLQPLDAGVSAAKAIAVLDPETIVSSVMIMFMLNE